MDFALSEELQMIRDMARDFVTNELLPIESQVLVLDGQPGKRGAPIPREKYDALKKKAVDQGLWAMTAPEALGGGGLSTLGACLVAEELGKTFVDFDFGDVPPILFEANAEQIEKYLKPAIAGEKEIALALREPKGDEITTSASRDGDAWILNGTKFAKEADIHLVFARADIGATCFIVENLVTQDRNLILKDARVPASNVFGEIGKAFALGEKHQVVGDLAGDRALERLLQIGLPGVDGPEVLPGEILLHERVQVLPYQGLVVFEGMNVGEDLVVEDASHDAGQLQRELLRRRQAIDAAHDRALDGSGQVQLPEVPRLGREPAYVAVDDQVARVA